MTLSRKNETTQLELFSPQTTAPKKSVTIAQSFFIGAVAGDTEVLCNHWLWTMKTRMQLKLPFTLSPSILLQGMPANLLSMAPISAIQIGINRAIETTFFDEGQPSSALQGMSASALAGASSALVSCPTERIMTHQGKKNLNFIGASKYLIHHGGIAHGLYAGLLATMVRESMFTVSYKFLAPHLKPYIVPYFSNDFSATAAAGVTAGVIGALCSQPADIIKTKQQGAHPVEKIKFTGAVRNIYQTSGPSGLVKVGLFSRTARIAIAVPLMFGMDQLLTTKLSRP